MQAKDSTDTEKLKLAIERLQDQLQAAGSTAEKKLDEGVPDQVRDFFTSALRWLNAVAAAEHGDPTVYVQDAKRLADQAIAACRSVREAIGGSVEESPYTSINEAPQLRRNR